MITPRDISVTCKPTQKSDSQQSGGVDRFLITAKELTVKNYNDHRKDGRAEIVYSEVFVVWFSKTIGNWKALCATTRPDGLYYEITHNGYAHETYVDVYKKIGKAIYKDPESTRKVEQVKKGTNK